MTTLASRVEALEVELYAPVLSQTEDWDRRSLLALHAAVAARATPFVYLEIGSYLGGSLQVLMRDPRCRRVLSIDSRPALAADKRRGTCAYKDNSTNRMRELLAALPGVDMSKLQTFDQGTDALTIAELPARPDYCFIDGEHTDEAALRDGRFCAEALGGQGVIAFHDYPLVKPGISAFLREAWSEVSTAIAFTGLVFAVEFGGRRVLDQAVIDRAIGSNWHRLMWRSTSRSGSPVPLLMVWSAMPFVDTAAARVRTALGAVSGHNRLDDRRGQ
jgi:Methyltransferase domain